MRILAILCVAMAAPAAIIEVDLNTTLLNSTNFTAGFTYFATFQLNSAGIASGTQARISKVELAGGTGNARNVNDPTAGNFALGPAPGLAAGLWQTDGILDLSVDPQNSNALFTQSFQAGSAFRFTLELVTTLSTPNVAPDQFAFQLYDSDFSTLLYDTAIDAMPNEAIPEPGSLGMLAAGLVAVAVSGGRWRRLSGR